MARAKSAKSISGAKDVSPEDVRQFFSPPDAASHWRIVVLPWRPLHPAHSKRIGHITSASLSVAAVAMDTERKPKRYGIETFLYHPGETAPLVSMRTIRWAPRWDQTLTARIRILEMVAQTFGPCPACCSRTRLIRWEQKYFWKCVACEGYRSIDSALQPSLYQYCEPMASS